MWRDAIRVAVMRAQEDPKKGKRLQALADALIAQGLAGDVSALKEIGDRLDGKPMQTVNATVTQRLVARIPEPANTVDEWVERHSPVTH